MQIRSTLVATLLAPLAISQEVQLSSVTSHATSAWQPRALNAGDFDGDGMEDLLVSHTAAPHQLVLLAATGSHSLTPSTSTSAANVLQIVSGRFDGNSLRDIAWLSTSGAVVAQRGSGGGSFAAPATVGQIAGASSIATGDFDNDGKSDLVVTSSSAGTITLLRGDGAGGFTAGASSPCGPSAAFVQAGNLDGDSYRDVAVANVGAAQVSVLFNSAAGFSAPLAVSVPSPVVALDLGDVDADGNVDLVVCSASAVSIVRGNGAGSFGAPSTYAIGATAKRAVVFDATGDGALDIVVACAGPGRLAVLENRGAAGFALGATVPVAGPVSDLAVGDFDADGRIDVALATNANYSNVWIAWGLLQAIHDDERMQTTGIIPTRVRAADIDADGDVDLLSNGTGWGFVLRRNTGGGFAPPQVIAGNANADALEVLDIDGDARLDVITANDYDGYADVFLGQPGGALQLAASQRCGRSPFELAFADFDGDGVIDCAAANLYHHNVSLRRGLGGGTFSNFVEFGGMTSPFDVAAIDSDFDGDLDLVVATFGSISPGLVLLRNDGTGSFANAGVLTPDKTQQVEAVDLDGDGDLDLAMPGSNTRELILLQHTGPDQYTVVRVASPAFYPHAVEAADFDADGDVDVALGHAFHDSVSWYEQVAPATWHYVGQEPAGTDPTDLTAADFDGDGVLDLAVASFYSFDLHVFSGAHALYGDVVPYCTAKVNSLGCTPELAVTGVPSASSPLPCTILATAELNLAPGLLFYGFAAAATPFGGGTLCVALPLHRTPIQSAGGNPIGVDCSGSYSFDWNALVRSGADPALVPGSTAFAQFWSRDSGSPSPFNLTSAVKLVTAP